MNGAAATAPNRASWRRLALLIGTLVACVLLPFLLWGATLDTITPGWLAQQDAWPVYAVAGIALLVADVLLPVPASVVAMALCWRLGPITGGVCVAIGGLLAFSLGYTLGRLLPQARLRSWIGAELWERVSSRAHRYALWWIVLARPLPLLAEVSALLAGVLRVPPLRAFAHAAAGSVAVGVLFGLSAWLGQSQPGLSAMLLTMLALPTLLWIAHRLVLRQLQARGEGSGR